ncbi:Uncharacterized protein Adt_35599 [Abeliophyllum distichum]|uniref:Retrotransposon gag domain-containing protein n=1 Tax=Abeliophyllum distichum TaxID=126358 RepID=A0ABD1QH12_9LAMI
MLETSGISSWPELKKTFINYFSSGRPCLAPVQCLHDMRQEAGKPLQSYLSCFNKEMLFYKRLSDAKTLSGLKGGLNINLPFWRDARNKNPTTFNQLVKIITEEITNENMILYRNRGELAPSPILGVGYGRGQHRPLQQQT